MQEALWRMEDSRLSVEQLTALSRAVPEEQERRDIGPLPQGVTHTSILPACTWRDCDRAAEHRALLHVC